ncbi:MAG: anhydro-N-acetylmuramic acid kinase [Flavobacteriales bacterium]
MEKRIIGLMSGTSLDGLDIAYVHFSGTEDVLTFSLEAAETVALPVEIKAALHAIETLSSREVFKLNQRIGRFYADAVNEFIQTYNLEKTRIDAIASHGQTIFHQPEDGYTVQLGCGSTLAYHSGLPVINDFRSLDVAAGGQGAPLVPIGDQLLFGTLADAYINIGGFANISFKTNANTLAFDVCPGNLPMNAYARQLGKEYDVDGEIAATHQADPEVLNTLNNLPYYKLDGPKSLGTEWLDSTFYPSIPSQIEPAVAIATINEHLADQLANVLEKHTLKRAYITGGGALNTSLMNQLKSKYSGEVIIPSAEIVHFKEAIIFAFLGFRFLNQQFNSLASVTGAKENVCGGALHYPR